MERKIICPDCGHERKDVVETLGQMKVRKSGLERALEALEAPAHRLERRTQRLAVAGENVGPEFRVAVGNAGEVAEARAARVGGALGSFVERAREGEGQQVRQVAHPGDLRIVFGRLP